jgi:hypothetical protein
MLSKILLSRLRPYVLVIIGTQQCGFRCNRSTTDQILCISQIMEKKILSSMRQYISCLIDFKKAYDSVRTEVLYDNLIDLGVTMKVVRLNKICLNKTKSL